MLPTLNAGSRKVISQMEKFEILMAWKRGDSIRKIARDSGFSRNTMTAYVNEFRRSEEAIALSPKEIDFYLSVEF